MAFEINTPSQLTQTIVASAPRGGFASEFVSPPATVELGLYSGGIAKLDSEALKNLQLQGAQPFGTPFQSVDGSVNEIAYSMKVRGLNTVIPVHQARKAMADGTMLDLQMMRATQVSGQLRIGKEFDIKNVALNQSKYTASNKATPSTLWDASGKTGAQMVADVRTGLEKVEDNSGAVANKILFGRKAWRLFSAKVTLNNDSDADLRINEAHRLFSGVDECQVAGKTYQDELDNSTGRSLIWDDDFVLCFADDTSEAMVGAEGDTEERLADGEMWGFMHTIRPGVQEGGLTGEVFEDVTINPPGAEMTVCLLYDIESWIDYSFAYLIYSVDA